jgi:hypothetical protein
MTPVFIDTGHFAPSASRHNEKVAVYRR